MAYKIAGQSKVYSQPSQRTTQTFIPKRTTGGGGISTTPSSRQLEAIKKAISELPEQQRKEVTQRTWTSSRLEPTPDQLDTPDQPDIKAKDVIKVLREEGVTSALRTAFTDPKARSIESQLRQEPQPRVMTSSISKEVEKKTIPSTERTARDIILDRRKLGAGAVDTSVFDESQRSSQQARFELRRAELDLIKKYKPYEQKTVLSPSDQLDLDFAVGFASTSKASSFGLPTKDYWIDKIQEIRSRQPKSNEPNYLFDSEEKLSEFGKDLQKIEPLRQRAIQQDQDFLKKAQASQQLTINVPLSSRSEAPTGFFSKLDFKARKLLEGTGIDRGLRTADKFLSDASLKSKRSELRAKDQTQQMREVEKRLNLSESLIKSGNKKLETVGILTRGLTRTPQKVTDTIFSMPTEVSGQSLGAVRQVRYEPVSAVTKGAVIGAGVGLLGGSALVGGTLLGVGTKTALALKVLGTGLGTVYAGTRLYDYSIQDTAIGRGRSATKTVQEVAGLRVGANVGSKAFSKTIEALTVPKTIKPISVEAKTLPSKTGLKSIQTSRLSEDLTLFGRKIGSRDVQITRGITRRAIDRYYSTKRDPLTFYKKGDNLRSGVIKITQDLKMDWQKSPTTIISKATSRISAKKVPDTSSIRIDETFKLGGKKTKATSFIKPVQKVEIETPDLKKIDTAYKTYTKSGSNKITQTITQSKEQLLFTKKNEGWDFIIGKEVGKGTSKTKLILPRGIVGKKASFKFQESVFQQPRIKTGIKGQIPKNLFGGIVIPPSIVPIKTSIPIPLGLFPTSRPTLIPPKTKTFNISNYDNTFISNAGTKLKTSIITTQDPSTKIFDPVPKTTTSTTTSTKTDISPFFGGGSPSKPTGDVGGVLPPIIPPITSVGASLFFPFGGSFGSRKKQSTLTKTPKQTGKFISSLFIGKGKTRKTGPLTGIEFRKLI